MIFLGRRPTILILCLHRTLLMWLKAGPTKGKKATDVRSSLGISSLPDRLTAHRICHFSNSIWMYYRRIPTLLVADGSARTGL